MVGQEESGKIFVGGLSWDTDQDSLQNYFSQFGEVSDCIVMKNPQTGKSRGFGFVSYKDPASVDVVLSTSSHSIDGRKVDAKVCNVKGATPKPVTKSYSSIGRTTKVFVGGLPANADDETIRASFARFGTVTDVVIMMDHEKGRSRGFGFLTFENEDSVEQACAEHFVDVNGKQVECKKAEPRGAASRNATTGMGRGFGRAAAGGGGGYEGGQQGWGQGAPQSNWTGQGGWSQDYNQQNWGSSGWNQGNYSANGNWGQGQGGAQVMSQHGMGGGPQGMSGSTQSIGGIPQGQSVGSGYDSYGQFAQPNLAVGQTGQSGMTYGGGYGQYTQPQGGYSSQQGQGDGQPAAGGGGGYGYGSNCTSSQQNGQQHAYSGYGGTQGAGGASYNTQQGASSYGDSQQGRQPITQQNAYGGGYSTTQQGGVGYGGQSGGGGGQSLLGGQGIGSSYEQRQTTGNMAGGAGRSAASQSYHPYHR